MDWEQYVLEIASDIMKEQSPKRLISRIFMIMVYLKFLSFLCLYCLPIVMILIDM